MLNARRGKEYLVKMTVVDQNERGISGAEVVLDGSGSHNSEVGTTNSQGIANIYCENWVYTVNVVGLDDYTQTN